jgi:hypothetical protein
MNAAVLNRVVEATSRFLTKVKRQNEPFQAFLTTDAYKTFYAALKDATLTQGQSVAAELKKANQANTLAFNDDMQPLTDSQLPHMKQLVKDSMPKLADLISHETVYKTLYAAFVYSVKAQYKRWGLMVKATGVEFSMTNKNYIKMLNDQSNYLLNLSSIDDTTTDQLVTLIKNGKMDGLTIDEIASEIEDQFDGISDNRAFVISRTETAQAMGSGNLATMVENGVQTKHWVIAGGNVCPICEGNAAQGSIPVSESFDSGDDCEPAHPNCECYTEADEIDLDSINIWDGE